MAHWTHTENPAGSFVEREVGNTFEFSGNDSNMPYPWNFPHKIWVGGLVNDQGWRHGTVKKSVAYIVVDEDKNGDPVVEKWQIRNMREYA